MRTWAEVDLNAILFNIKSAREKLSPNTKLLCVVKADGYGHGAYEISQTALKAGADYLAVATAQEAVDLRKKGIHIPIMILGVPDKDDIKSIVEYDITATVFSLNYAKLLSDEAIKQNKKCKVHIKIDTGMSRIGYITFERAICDIPKICNMPGIFAEGIFSHFSKADESDSSYTDYQFERFMKIINSLKDIGIEFKIKHICNSAGMIRFPKYHLDMVRNGIALYGHYPSDIFSEKDIVLKPAMTFKSNVVNIKTIPEGTSVGYGGKFVSEKETKVATVAVGYADGYPRALSQKADVLINGHRCRILGNVCMDQMMVDITGFDDIKFGDEVILFGKSGDNNITVEELADLIGTINYEILCGIGKRVPRIYKNMPV